MEIRKGRINYRGQGYAALILLEYVWDKIKLLDLTCDYLFWEVVLGYSITVIGGFMLIFTPQNWRRFPLWLRVWNHQLDNYVNMLFVYFWCLGRDKGST